jgi:hypothetical protein
MMFGETTLGGAAVPASALAVSATAPTHPRIIAIGVIDMGEVYHPAICLEFPET